MGIADKIKQETTGLMFIGDRKSKLRTLAYMGNLREDQCYYCILQEVRNLRVVREVPGSRLRLMLSGLVRPTPQLPSRH